MSVSLSDTWRRGVRRTHVLAPRAVDKPARDKESATAPFLLARRGMSTVVDERERRLIEAVVALARALRDERDRLAGRLREVEDELSSLATRLDVTPLEPAVSRASD